MFEVKLPLCPFQFFYFLQIHVFENFNVHRVSTVYSEPRYSFGFLNRPFFISLSIILGHNPVERLN